MLHLVMSVVVSWWAVPRVGRLYDQRVTRQRFQHQQTVVDSPTRQHHPTKEIDTAEVFDLLAMKIRSGIDARHALDVLANDRMLPKELELILCEKSELPLEKVLITFRNVTRSSSHELLATLLLQAYRHQSLEPSALDLAAQCARDTTQRVQRVRAATAHSRLTLRILTVMPIAALALSAVVSSTMRRALIRPLSLTLILFGTLLDVGGWIWMRNITSSVEKLADPTDLHQLLTSMSISLTAGDSLLIALDRSGDVNSLGFEISTSLAHGNSLAQALQYLDDRHGQLGNTVKRVLLDNQRAGTSLIDVVGRLLHDSGAKLNHQVDTRIQQLSTALTLPTVFCVLPAFLLLALMPVAIASFGALPASAV